MGLRQTLSRLGLGVVCAAAPTLALGCHTTRKLTTEVSESLFTAVAEPATDMGCMWKKQIAYLPDPTRDGVQGAGITGVMNLYAADGLPTRADGDLQIMAYDETLRTAEQSAKTPSMWHFDPVTLKKLRSKDERGMDCTLLFLPWPQDWSDVTKVRLQVKYIQKIGGTSIHTPDQVVAFEVENQPGVGGGIARANSTKNGIGDKRGIPDLKRSMELAMGRPAAKATDKPQYAVAPQAMPAVAQAGEIMPTAPLIIPASANVPVAPSMPIQLPGKMEPIVNPDTAPMARPTPPPPPMMPQAVVPATPVIAKPETVSVRVGEGLPALEIPAAK